MSPQGPQVGVHLLLVETLNNRIHPPRRAPAGIHGQPGSGPLLNQRATSFGSTFAEEAACLAKGVLFTQAEKGHSFQPARETLGYVTLGTEGSEAFFSFFLEKIVVK